MSIGTEISHDPAVQQLVTNARAAGVQLLGDAKTFIHASLAHLQGSVDAEIPVAEQAAIDLALDLIPSGATRDGVKAFVNAFATPAEATLGTEAKSLVATAFGIALLRADAILATAGAK
ncbi:MAG: hypothetical protein JWO85_2562 [Candidatus Eremiobacteraeota bacterium]|nr:hypothetical protein [Candidatus Eremiobacteraeota bacterium]